MTTIIPPYLKKGDKVYFLAPSGFMPIDQVQKCIKTFKNWGFEPIIGNTVGLQHHYFAGTELQRLTDLQYALNEPSIKAIFCVRGGYGLSHIIDKIDFNLFCKTPKWIIGFSDITILQNHIFTVYGIASIHSPMANAFNYDNADKIGNYIYDVLIGKKISYIVPPNINNQFGKVTGVLVGGNLSLIAHLIGTSSAINTQHKILFLEDVGEYLYNIDRMIIQLARSNVFKNMAGLVLGGFTDLKDTNIGFGSTLTEILTYHFKNFKIPIVYDFPISHSNENLPVKIGSIYTLEITDKNTTLVTE